MIEHTTFKYVSYYKTSKKNRLPPSEVHTHHRLTKMSFESDQAFCHTLKFFNRKCRVVKNHRLRPEYKGLKGYHKIKVDLRNKKIYLVKRTYRKRNYATL